MIRIRMRFLNFVTLVAFVLGLSAAEDNTTADDSCPEKAFEVSCEDDDENEYTTLLEVDGQGNEPNVRSERKRRGASRPESLEQHFQFTKEKKLFYDLLDGQAPHDKTVFHKPYPEGYAESDRTTLLLYDVKGSWYPPWSYRGLYEPKSWHQIPIENLLKKRNRSFMMLEHFCEQLPKRALEMQCAGDEYKKLPRCKSEDQSPININTKTARESSLKEFDFTNLKEGENVTKFPFMMSLPWDGTDVLTVELLDGAAHKPPGVERGSISGTKLYLERIHIHYGENQTVGSEHMIDNKTYAMELQFVFSFREKDPEGMRTKSDLQYFDLLMKYYTKEGVANRYKHVHIISLLVNVKDDKEFNKSATWDDDWNQKAVLAFRSLSYAARKFWAIHNILRSSEESVVDPDPSTTTAEPSPDPPPQPSPVLPFKYRAVISKEPEGLELGAFFPPRVPRETKQSKQWHDSIYYNYKGGLTHPPCFSYIEWDVYDRPLVIPTSMWQNFLYVHSEFDDTKFIAGNYRSPSDIYIQALDKDDTGADFPPEKKDAARKRIQNRDIRRSRTTGTSNENYDYDEVKNGSRTGQWISYFLIQCSYIILLKL